MELTSDEYRRYARHLTLAEVGEAGQRRLKSASVLCIGAGGLGSPVLLYLAAAGVGRIGVIDGDVVDFSNLQRQIIHGTPDVGKPKTESVRARLAAINPAVVVETYSELLSSTNALSLFAKYDLIVDGTDNFPTRYLINDAAVLTGKVVVQGAVNQFEGQVSVFGAPEGPCYRCLFPEPPPPGTIPSCAEAGVLGAVVGVVGSLQATEALKLLLGVGDPLIGRLMTFEALSMRFRDLRIRKNSRCPLCGDVPTITKLIDYERFCGLLPQGERKQTMREITPVELKAKMDKGEDFLLLDVREPSEFQFASIPGAVLIPLGEIERRYEELPEDKEIVLQCRSGMRSAQALGFLQAKGFTNLANLKGGILAWSDTVDPTVPKY